MFLENNKNEISPSPLIKIKDILILFYKIKNFRKKKYYQNLYNSSYCVSFARSTYSLFEIYNFFVSLYKIKGNIFIPDYICNESLSLLRSTNAKLIFYDHTLINNKKLIIEMKKKKANIFIFVNYFGESNNLNNEILDFLKNNKIIIIEDNTHCLFNISKYNSDVEFFSPYKLFGIPDGSIIKFRDKSIYKKFTLYKNINNPYLLTNLIFGNLYFLIYLIKKSIRKVFGYKYEKINFEFVSYPKKYIRKYISPLSKYILNLYSHRVEEYKNKRIENYYFWKDKLELIIPFLKMEKLNYVPYLGLIKFESNSARVNILKLYSEFGLPIGTWPDLPPEVIKSKLNFHSAKNKFKNQITVPLHQDITKSQIDICINKCFRKYINSFELSNSIDNKIKIYFSKKFIGNVIILFNNYTKQNILRLEFINNFYETYVRSENFFYKVSIEFIIKLKINKKIYLPVNFKHLTSNKYFIFNGIADNIIPLLYDSKLMGHFILSYLKVINNKKIENILINSNIKPVISNKILNNVSIDFFDFKLGFKILASFEIVKKIDHVILFNQTFFEHNVSFDKYLIYLCEYYKKENFKYLEINNKIINTKNKKYS